MDKLSLRNRVGFGGVAVIAHRLTKLLILSIAFFLLSCKDESGLSAQGICPTDLKKYTLEEKKEAIKKYAYKDYLETINEIERTKKLRFHSYRIVGGKYPDLQPFWEYEGNYLSLLEHLTYEQFIQNNEGCCDIVRGFPVGMDGIVAIDDNNPHERNLAHYVLLKYEIKYFDRQKKIQTAIKIDQLGVGHCAKVSSTNGFDKPYKF